MCWQIGQTEKLQAHNSLPSDGKTYIGIVQNKQGGCCCCHSFQRIIHFGTESLTLILLYIT